jgi:hypothetical protein
VHFALNEHEGLFIKREEALVEDLLAAGEETGFVGAGVGGGLEVEGREGWSGAHGWFFLVRESVRWRSQAGRLCYIF